VPSSVDLKQTLTAAAVSHWYSEAAGADLVAEATIRPNRNERAALAPTARSNPVAFPELLN
jgi:hypothetical protein